MFPLTEQLAREAIAGDKEAKLALLTCFSPLCARCVRHAAQILPCEERNVLLGAVAYEFFLLLAEFDSHRGLPFGGYITVMLPRRVLNWARKERRHLCQETAFGENESEENGMEETSCAAWPGCNAGWEEHEETELRLWWEQVSRELTERQRQVMELTLQGLTGRDIAKQLGVTQPGVHRLKCSAQKKLQKKWQEFL